MPGTDPSARPIAAPRKPASRPDACSTMWAAAGEPAWGTAAGAAFWVAIEQPGPWGRHAMVESRMDPALGRALEDYCAKHGGRALLIRSVGTSRGADPAHPRRVFVAGGMLHWQPWLLSAELGMVADLLRMPWERLRYGDRRAVTEALPVLGPHPDPVLLVCTNGKRDACCAVRGRPLAAEAAAALPGQVWECTHTGGHRFAPTGVLLPHGQTLGRLTAGLAVAAVSAAAEERLALQALDPVHNRGFAHLMPQCQAAEAYIRRKTGETRVAKVRARPMMRLVKGQSGIVEVQHRDGRTWQLEVRLVTGGQERPNSCATAAVPVESWSVHPAPTDVPKLGAWPDWPG